MKDERFYWLSFSLFPGIGPLKFKKLLNEFGTAEKAWKAPLDSLKKVIGDITSEKFDNFRKDFSVENYLLKLKKADVWFITSNDPFYPSSLLQIKNPPFVLFGRGLKFDKLKNELERTIAIVGTRKLTNYGREVTEIFTRDLSASGFTIVSGLALGIDSVSHQTALESGGKTIAVLGCGVDCCTPTTNQGLYDKIIKGNGAIISEVPLSYMPSKGLFPSRNRIISGLSLGVLVTEGAEDSGSLITGNLAFSQNRKVFAVPGPITSDFSKGPYKLIEKGAKLVTSAEDILKDLGLKTSDLRLKKSKVIKGETREEGKILTILQNEPLYFDEIVKRSKLDSSKVGSLLSIMEIKGLIKNSGSFYSINN
ncbi:MAG: DNA protecting protein DprA [Candidatus Levybacteria bacterium RIFCSPLOWO2_01_FULL_38_13]|nr:MAG: DNA protecting protein DprA [Candidatus Levybacteria bacterium RIFCSPHIGHO2_01_FULL_41_15]OGH35735.1 MAG: DNA protecting protein DprA [Candidatus Levybacteria bacterium RIFCSPLOWO2_01_FULL_38_13]